jgi:hypothetical protein
MSNFVRNFETGQVITLEKHKPKAEVKGKAFVELFDERTKKKILEAETENVINNVLVKDAFLTTYDSLIGWNSISAMRRSLFQNIVLTNYIGAEDANNFFISGDIIGWAARQGGYVGADVQRGTINIAESSRDYGEFKFVFDFPTHAANGTFRSIWWGGVNGYIPLLDFQSIGSNGISGTYNNSYRACLGPGAAVYVPQNTGIIVVKKTSYNDSNYPDYFSNTSSDTIDLSYIDTKIQGIWWDGEFFWLYGDTNKKYYKCDASFAVLLEFEAPPGAYSSSTRYNFTTFNGKFFTFTYESSTNWSFRRYSYQGVLETELNLYGQEGITAPSSMFIVGDAKCLLFHESNLRKMALVDANGNTLKFAVDTNLHVSNSYFYNNLMYDCKHNLYWARYNYYSNYSLYCLQPLWYPGAQTLLASPVTKTNSNTMKVTYTFRIDLPTY